MITRTESVERRAHPRLRLHRPAVVFVGDERLPAQAIDVSESGIGVALSGDGPTGTFVRVNFNVDEPKAGAVPWLDVDGVVVRTRAQDGAFVWGIRFLSAPPGVVAGIKARLAATQAARQAARVPTAAAPRPASPPQVTKSPSSSPASSPAVPHAVSAPRVVSRQASDLRELYRSALDQVKAERARAKKR